MVPAVSVATTPAAIASSRAESCTQAGTSGGRLRCGATPASSGVISPPDPTARSAQRRRPDHPSISVPIATAPQAVCGWLLASRREEGPVAGRQRRQLGVLVQRSVRRRATQATASVVATSVDPLARSAGIRLIPAGGEDADDDLAACLARREMAYGVRRIRE